MILHAAVLALGNPAASGPPEFDTAVLNAVDFCTQVATGGDISMTYPGDLYMDLPKEVSERTSVKTFHDVPALIHRFAKTSPSGRMGRAEFASVRSQTGPVWISYGTQLPLCDIAVTGQKKVADPATGLVQGLETGGWSVASSNAEDTTAPLRTIVLLKPAGDEGEVFRMTINQLLVGADPEGIQMDLQLMRGRMPG